MSGTSVGDDWKVEPQMRLLEQGAYGNSVAWQSLQMGFLNVRIKESLPEEL